MVCTTSFPPLIPRVEHGVMGGVEHGTMGGVEYMGKIVYHLISTTYYTDRTQSNGEC